MSSFDDRLLRVLSEMPVRHFKAAGRTFQPGDRKSGFEVFDINDPSSDDNNKSYEGYVSPKYMGIVSDKLSRLIGYNINIFVTDGGLNQINYNVNYLSHLTGVPVSELSDAINFMMVGNNRQRQFSPWLYMHQLGEALNNICRVDLAGTPQEDFGRYKVIGKRFVKFYAEIKELVPDWVYRLKMGSARQAKSEGGRITDLHQELITEFLWHGGKIRFDYPDGVDRREVDALFDNFKTTLRALLDKCVGRIIENDDLDLE
jgi:hypothetical protein